MRRSILQNHVALALAVFVAVLLLQLPLVLNPGYFSHDELQWAAFASAGQTFSWTAYDAFQYRPLTFNLWLWLSKRLFDHPQGFHAVVVGLGALNAALLALLARRMAVAPVAALVGALVFALGPYAMYVHGWVGTLGDLLWVGFALLAGLATTCFRNWLAVIASVAVLTTLALLSKEAAVSIPALLGVGWWFLGRPRIWAVAAGAAAVPVLLYLALHLDVLMHAPRDGGQYLVSLAHVPVRWLELHLFPTMLRIFEIYGMLASAPFGKRFLLAAASWLALLAALWQTGPRWLLAYLALGLCALGPVLLLAAAANNYGYAFAAATSMLVAAAWQHASRPARGVFLATAALVLLHGASVMLQMRRVGELQAVFSPAVAEALADPAARLRLKPADEGQRWIFERLVHQIPSYQGMHMGDRVSLAGQGEPADALIENDGRLRPLR